MSAPDNSPNETWAPARACLGEITPSDDDDLTALTTGIAFATAGALAYRDGFGHDVVVPSGVLAAGIMHPIRAQRILATNTTVQNVVGWY